MRDRERDDRDFVESSGETDMGGTAETSTETTSTETSGDSERPSGTREEPGSSDSISELAGEVATGDNDV